MRNRKIKLGRYRHYKGKEYEVLGVARHSETLEELVVYKALYGAHDTWVRPLKMFMAKVVVGDKKVPRFKYIPYSHVLENMRIRNFEKARRA